MHILYDNNNPAVFVMMLEGVIKHTPPKSPRLPLSVRITRIEQGELAVPGINIGGRDILAPEGSTVYEQREQPKKQTNQPKGSGRVQVVNVSKAAPKGTTRPSSTVTIKAGGVKSLTKGKR